MISGAPATVVAMVLYGSHARGDADDASDTDVAVFSHATTARDLEIVKRTLVALGGALESPDFSVYSTATAGKMAEAGSLFLWHLRLEGRVLYEEAGWLEGLWQRLKPYSAGGAAEAVDVIEMVVSDIVIALSGAPTTTPFEAATLFSMVRTLGMVIGQATGKPAFGRRSSVDRLRATLGSDFTLTPSELANLEGARLAYSGKAEARSCAGDVQQQYLGAALKVIRMIEPIRRMACSALEIA